MGVPRVTGNWKVWLSSRLLCMWLASWSVAGSTLVMGQPPVDDLPDPFQYLPQAAVQNVVQNSPSVDAAEDASSDAAGAEPQAPAANAKADVEAPGSIAEEEAPKPDPRADGDADGEDRLRAPADEAEVQLPDGEAQQPVPAGDSVLQANYQRGLLIDVNGPIFDRFHWYLNNRLDQAQQQGVDLIILRLTSPGGDLEHSLQLGRRLRDIDWATTVAFIPEEAISGGAMIALGCDRIYMQSGALLGDAGPIRMGLGGQFEHAEEKIVSYTVGAIRELAAGQNRPAALAEAMVDRNVTVFEATERATGKLVYLSEKEFNEAGVAERYELGPAVPETGQNRFLTVGAARALELQLSEGVFDSEAQLLDQLDVAALERTQLTWIDKTVFTLNRPWLTALLLIVGLIGLYMELAAPGLSLAGLGSMFCFGIFFWSHFLGGTAGWLEVLLFGMGVVCLAIELFVVPGFGVFGLSGLVLVVMSLVMASQDFVIPSDAAEWGQFRVNLLIVLGSVLGVLVLFFAQIMLLDSLPGLNRFRLATPAGEAGGGETQAMGGLLRTAASSSRQAVPVGAAGVAESDLRPSGKVLINEQLVDVITEGDYVPAGTRVEVLRVEGNRIIVRRLA